MNFLQFTAVIKIRGINPYVYVSKEQATQIKSGWKKAMPVMVQINGKPDKPWQINMMPIGDGNFYLYLHGNIRKASHTKVGDTVRVAVCFDSKYHNGPMQPMPSWFSVALEKNLLAKTSWDALIPSRKKEIIRYFSQLKSTEARTRNLEQILSILSGKGGRFMARNWEKKV